MSIDKGKKNFLILMGTLVLVFLILVGLETRKFFKADFKAVFLNVGQGDSALIRFENREKLLVDCGPDRMVLSALGRNLSFFERTIDNLIITHADLDHYGGCVDVLKRYKVKKIFLNGERENNQYYKELERVIEQEKSEIKIISKPEDLVVAGFVMNFLNPDPELELKTKIDESNDRSIVFKMTQGDKKYLFTGDAEMELEKAMVAKYCQIDLCPVLKSKVLKAGHHGSESSSSEEFLKAVNPESAVISVGKNRFGHPSFRVVRRLERLGIKVLRTDMLGDILLK